MQDKIGLKKMDERKGLKMLREFLPLPLALDISLTHFSFSIHSVCKGIHMQIDSACQSQIFGVYAGTSTSLLPFSFRKFFYSKGLSPELSSNPMIYIPLLCWTWLLTLRMVVVVLSLLSRRRERAVELEGEERLLRAEGGELRDGKRVEMA